VCLQDVEASIYMEVKIIVKYSGSCQLVTLISSTHCLVHTQTHFMEANKLYKVNPPRVNTHVILGLYKWYATERQISRVRVSGQKHIAYQNNKDSNLCTKLSQIQP
jgi:hypothetical protein